MKENEWAIMDDDGIIHSGTEEEMRNKWHNKHRISDEVNVNGDLKLIEIHDVSH